MKKIIILIALLTIVSLNSYSKDAQASTTKSFSASKLDISAIIKDDSLKISIRNLTEETFSFAPNDNSFFLEANLHDTDGNEFKANFTPNDWAKLFKTEVLEPGYSTDYAIFLGPTTPKGDFNVKAQLKSINTGKIIILKTKK